MDPNDDAYRKWLTRTIVALCKSTKDLDDLLMYLSQKRLVTDTTIAIVKDAKGNTQQCFQLYTHLGRCVFADIDNIVDCLRASDNEPAAKLFSDFKELTLGQSASPAVVLDFTGGDNQPLVVNVKKATSLGLGGDPNNRYKMISTPRGLALIINNHEFSDPKHNRAGSEYDYATMQKLLGQLDFEVIAHENVTSNALAGILTDFKTHTLFKEQKVDACFVCVMSHGAENILLMADGKTINYWSDLVWEFGANRFPLFEAKPKIFVIQACAGFFAGAFQNLGTGAVVKPDLSNVLVCSSTLPGTKTGRNKYKGTYYINCLAQVIMNEAYRTEAKKLFGDMVQEEIKKTKNSDGSIPQPPMFNPINFKKDFYFNPGLPSA